MSELAEVVLKISIFDFDKKTFKHKRGTEIETKFTLTYAILFIIDFEEKVLKSFEKIPMIWWRYDLLDLIAQVMPTPCTSETILPPSTSMLCISF